MTGGFTLLEALVGIAVASLLMVALYAGVRLVARSWDGARVAAAHNEDVRIVHEFLARHLERSLPVVESDGGRPSLRFAGERDRIAFLAEMPPRLGVGGVHELAIDVRDGGAGADGELVLARRLYGLDPDRSGPPDAERRVLVAGVNSIEFEYFGRRERDENGEWADEWIEERRLPDLVRMRIVDGAGNPWPELVVRLRVDAVRSRLGADTSEGDAIESLHDAPGADETAPGTDAPGAAPAGVTG